MTNSSTREMVARIIDPKAFSHLYCGNRDEAKWLANKKRAIEAAIRKADAVLAIIAAPVGGEVVEVRNVARGVLLEAAWEAAAWLGAGDNVAEEKLVPAILAADPDQAYARQALSELGFDVPSLSPDPTEGGTDE